MAKEFTIALAGNPNVGKSTVFNALTGLKQHTGNWTGKTVENARGKARHNGKEYIIMDLPGTYSLMSYSKEEEAARDYICYGGADVVAVIADATCLERNLNLLFQVMEITPRVVLCVNLMDEARKKDIFVDTSKLKQLLGIEVIGITATKKKEVYSVLEACEKAARQKNVNGVIYCQQIENAVSMIESRVKAAAGKQLNSRFLSLKLLGGEESILKSVNKSPNSDLLSAESSGLKQSLSKAKEYLYKEGTGGEVFIESIVCSVMDLCESVYKAAVTVKNENYNERDKKIDKILTSKLFGIPIMLLMLGVIFLITIQLSNYPSALLSKLFKFSGIKFDSFLGYIKVPYYIRSPIYDGMYKTATWVVSVMLPPMAIFFPLFTLLEDLGYLPRVAFNLDKPFKKCGCCGKQCLTMCMGFGCNAVGVMGARIIDSPRERLLAILTNNFVPCNGRFAAFINGNMFTKV